MAREFLKGTQRWPEGSVVAASSIRDMYARGFAGVWKDREAEERVADLIRSRGGYASAEDACHAFNLAETGQGQLVIPFLNVEKLYPGAYPGAAQQRGDCVSHDGKNAALILLCSEILSRKPDPVTGRVEGPPLIDPIGIKNGVLSSESLYWCRGYNGDGWSCSACVEVMLEELGCAWPRINYTELDPPVDLRAYSGRLAGLYGARKPPRAYYEQGSKHYIRQAAVVRSFEAIRDMLFNGYGVSSCGGEGYSSARDENGVSPLRGSWAHAMSIIGADDRPIIKEIYKEPLVLVMNSWGIWNSGPRRIRGTNINIPEGSFWARWSHVKNRYFTAVSNLDGWPARKLTKLWTGVLG